jgi:hypothetical protein
MKPSHEQWLTRLFAAMEIPVPDQARQLRRINTIERNIVLPVKTVFIVMIWYSFDIKPWFGTLASTLEVVVETVQYIFLFLRSDQLDRGPHSSAIGTVTPGRIAMDGGG